MQRCPWCGRDIDERATVCPWPDCSRVLGREAASYGRIPPPPAVPGSPGGPVSNVEHRTSNVEHRTPNVERPIASPPPPGGPVSNVEHRTPNMERPIASPPPPGGPVLNVEHRTSNVEHRTPNVERPIASPPPPGVYGGAPQSFGRPAAGPVTHAQGAGGMQGAPDGSHGLPANMGAAFWSAVLRAVHWSQPPSAPAGGAAQPPTPPPPVIAQPEAPEVFDYPVEETGVCEEEVVLRVEAENLRSRLQRSRRRRARLATAAVAIVALSGICGVVHYVHRVLGYAQLAPNITLRTDALDPERIVLSYRPVRAGRLAFRRSGPDRQTELLEEVPAEAIGKQQLLLWRAEGLSPGERIGVRYRAGWRLATHEITVARTDSDG